MRDNRCAMLKPTRRTFCLAAAATAAAVAAHPAAAAPPTRQRVLIGTNTAQSILPFEFDAERGTLAPAGGSLASLPNATWIAAARDNRHIFVASEASEFQGKPTGILSSFRVEGHRLLPVSAVNSASPGTCHCALDATGSVLVAADYGGGSASSYHVGAGQLSPLVWSEHYTGHGPRLDRQQAAHAHFASFSPDNRYAFINDLGSDLIHIYRLDVLAARLTPAGSYQAAPGAGPRTLHFHTNGHTAYSVNELNSTVDVLEWHDGQFTKTAQLDLLPAGSTGATRACDTVITADGRFVYFANRDHDFLVSCAADAATGALTLLGRSNCGGKTPRNFVLDPSERWMLVANQDSGNVSVFQRDTTTGRLAETGSVVNVPAPMRILFL